MDFEAGYVANLGGFSGSGFRKIQLCWGWIFRETRRFSGLDSPIVRQSSGSTENSARKATCIFWSDSPKIHLDFLKPSPCESTYRFATYPTPESTWICLESRSKSHLDFPKIHLHLVQLSSPKNDLEFVIIGTDNPFVFATYPVPKFPG